MPDRARDQSEARARSPIALSGHTPPIGMHYPGAPDVAQVLVTTLLEREFDVAVSTRIRDDGPESAGIPHAFGFVYRRLMRDDPPPSVPIS